MSPYSTTDRVPPPVPPGRSVMGPRTRRTSCPGTPRPRPRPRSRVRTPPRSLPARPTDANGHPHRPLRAGDRLMIRRLRRCSHAPGAISAEDQPSSLTSSPIRPPSPCSTPTPVTPRPASTAASSATTTAAGCAARRPQSSAAGSRPTRCSSPGSPPTRPTARKGASSTAGTVRPRLRPGSAQVSVQRGCPRIDWLFAQSPGRAWERISCGDGAKGPCVYHWAAIQLPTAAGSDYQTCHQPATLPLPSR